MKTSAEGGDESEQVNQQEKKEQRAIAQAESGVGGKWRDQSPVAPVL